MMTWPVDVKHVGEIENAIVFLCTLHILQNDCVKESNAEGKSDSRVR